MTPRNYPKKTQLLTAGNKFIFYYYYLLFIYFLLFSLLKRLRRALVHKFKGLHRDDVMSFLSADNDKKKSISPSRHRANNQQQPSSSFTSASLSHSNTPHSRQRSLSKDSGGTTTSTTTSMSYLDEFLAKALSYEPQSVINCFVPTKKPTEEVASYLKGGVFNTINITIMFNVIPSSPHLHTHTHTHTHT